MHEGYGRARTRTKTSKFPWPWCPSGARHGQAPRLQVILEKGCGHSVGHVLFSGSGVQSSYCHHKEAIQGGTVKGSWVVWFLGHSLSSSLVSSRHSNTRLCFYHWCPNLLTSSFLRITVHGRKSHCNSHKKHLCGQRITGERSLATSRREFLSQLFY